MNLQTFPPLDSATEAALRASIQRFGVLVPIVQDQHGRILDGHHRTRIADELGVDYDIQTREVENEEAARNIAFTLNVDRRHLTPSQRRPIVNALHTEGHSQHAIAGALGVSQKTVWNDLQEPLTTGRQWPERIVGLDGRSQPATRKGNGRPRTIDPRRPPAAARRLRTTMGALSGYQTALETFRVDLAILGASEDELAQWERTAGDLVRSLNKIRRALKEHRDA